MGIFRKSNIIFSEFFSVKRKLSIVWNWFIGTFILISEKYLSVWGLNSNSFFKCFATDKKKKHAKYGEECVMFRGK